MSRTLKSRAKGTPDMVPAADLADPTTRDIQLTKARHHADAIAVSMISRPRDGKNVSDVETSTERDVWRRADDLAGSTPTPLVKSLALTVALCEVDVRFRQALNGPMTTTVNRDHQSAFNGALRRYLAACRALAVVQRLNLPSIQVNMATNQVVANG